MKIKFEDKSYVECKKSEGPNKIFLIISALDQNDKLKRIVNAVELTMDEWKSLIGDIQ